MVESRGALLLLPLKIFKNSSNGYDFRDQNRYVRTVYQYGYIEYADSTIKTERFFLRTYRKTTVEG